MKKTNNTLSSIISHIFIFGFVILAVASVRQHITTVSPPTVPQKPVSKVAVASSPSEQKTSSVSSMAPSAPSVLTPTPSPYEAIKQSVQHEYTYRIFAAPDDPRYATNWALTKVNAPDAWNIATGNGQTVVAIIDTGFALNHEDLTNQWYTNPGETGMTQAGDHCWTGTPQSKQSNNCDDDNNGYIDDWRGWNFVINDNNPQAGRQNSSGAGVQHGTEVSGIAGATGNNTTGISAIDWNTKIMPLQALDDTGTGYTSDITAAVYYAVDNGAQVINLSLGAFENDPALQTAINYATTRNVVVVAAAGNCGDGTQSGCEGIAPTTIAYPAAYPNVISVGASTSTDQRASFGSYGAALDVSAPGYALPSSTSWSATNPTSLYSGALYGTSFASPQVASLVALIKSIRPSTSIADVAALIDATASKPAAMNGLFYSQQLGHGIINAGSALSIAQTLNGSLASPTLLQSGTASSEHIALASNALSSGCAATTTSACTIQFVSDNGLYTRYLPYIAVSAASSSGWTWSSDALEPIGWQIRARSGESVSPTPYYLLKKG